MTPAPYIAVSLLLIVIAYRLGRRIGRDEVIAEIVVEELSTAADRLGDDRLSEIREAAPWN